MTRFAGHAWMALFSPFAAAVVYIHQSTCYYYLCFFLSPKELCPTASKIMRTAIITE